MKKLIFAVICSFFLSSCTATENNKTSVTDYALGTIITVNIYDNNSESKALAEDCIRAVRDFEKIVSFTDKESELFAVNETAYEQPVHISDILFDIIESSLEYCKKSGGAFDIGCGGLIELWGIGTENAHIPTDESLEKYINFRGYEHIVLDYENKTIFFTDERVKIHLGACAKGYAEDLAADFLRKSAVESALLDFGGSITTIGTKNNKGFVIGVVNPRSENDYLAKISLSDRSVVTSGDYQRYFEADGVRYHHILDMNTGYPVSSDMNSVTVISESAFIADCLSTAVFVLGTDKGEALLEKENCSYIISADEIIISNGVDLIHND